MINVTPLNGRCVDAIHLDRSLNIAQSRRLLTQLPSTKKLGRRNFTNAAQGGNGASVQPARGLKNVVGRRKMKEVLRRIMYRLE